MKVYVLQRTRVVGPEDKYHVGYKHPIDYHGAVFPVTLKKEELCFVTFLAASSRCSAHSSSTWDIWADVDAHQRFSSKFVEGERVEIVRLQKRR